MNKITNVSQITNGAERIIESGVPYSATVTISGASDFLFHRWNCEAVDGFRFITSRFVWTNCVYNERSMMIPGTYAEMRADYD